MTWVHTNLLDLVLVPPRSMDLKVWHGEALVNQKPLVIDERERLEVKHHLADNPQVRSLSSWVTV